MNNFVSSQNEPVVVQPDSPVNAVPQKADTMERFLGWWFRLTTPPRPPANASFMKRENDRKARLLSTILFFYMLIQLLILTGSIVSAPDTILAALVGDVSLVICLWLCRRGNVTLGGWIMVGWYEFAMVRSLLTLIPFEPTDFPVYGMFIVGELLAVSLLPVYTVFIVAALNSAFIIFDVFHNLQIHAFTFAMNDNLTASAMIIPIALQIIVAGVTSVWVYSASRATERANRAEMVATLEHLVAEQRLSIEEEKQELEASIQQLVQLHVDATNGRIAARIPYPPSKVLWPLVGVINSLWMRLRNFQRTEREYERLKSAIAQYNDQLLRSRTIPLPQRTGTDLDLLIISLKKIQEPSSAPLTFPDMYE